MLPKTVVDLTVSYIFVDCEIRNRKPYIELKIKPALVAKNLPDQNVGLKYIDPETLKTFWQDSSITISTFEGSHILKSIGSEPSSALNTIFSNVISGVSSLVAAQFGVPRVVTPQFVGPTVGTECSPWAIKTRKEIKELTENIKTYQAENAKKPIDDKSMPSNSGGDTADQRSKNYAALIKAAQDRIAALESSLTLTIKRTIDPATPTFDKGVEDLLIDLNKLKSGKIDQRDFKSYTVESGVKSNGNIARIVLYDALDQLLDARWLQFFFVNPETQTRYNTEENDGQQIAMMKKYLEEDKQKKIEFIERHFSGESFTELRDLLTVNVYFNFDNSLPKITVCKNCRKKATYVGNNMQFREAIYIPLQVYQGNREKRGAKSLLDEPQRMAFAQFGPARALPLVVGPFESLKWSVTFLENGEMTAANFSSKSIGAQFTQFFSAAAGARYAIGAEERSAATTASSETQRLTVENNAMKAQIDNINFNNQLNALRSQGYAPQ